MDIINWNKDENSSPKKAPPAAPSLTSKPEEEKMDAAALKKVESFVKNFLYRSAGELKAMGFDGKYTATDILKSNSITDLMKVVEKFDSNFPAGGIVKTRYSNIAFILKHTPDGRISIMELTGQTLTPYNYDREDLR